MHAALLLHPVNSLTKSGDLATSFLILFAHFLTYCTPSIYSGDATWALHCDCLTVVDAGHCIIWPYSFTDWRIVKTLVGLVAHNVCWWDSVGAR